MLFGASDSSVVLIPQLKPPGIPKNPRQDNFRLLSSFPGRKPEHCQISKKRHNRGNQPHLVGHCSSTNASYQGNYFYCLTKKNRVAAEFRQWWIVRDGNQYNVQRTAFSRIKLNFKAVTRRVIKTVYFESNLYFFTNF